MLKRAFVFLLICCFNVSAHAAALHVIIAANTNDENIGCGARVNVEEVSAFVHKVARWSKLDLQLHVFQGNEYSTEAIVDCLHCMQPDSDDVVLYYHNTHGFRMTDMVEPWPALWCHDGSIRTQEILDLLKEKSQRLTLVFIDACNKVFSCDPAEHYIDLSFRWFRNNMSNYFRLFRGAKGTVVAASAQPGQSSWTIDYRGSLFTMSLLEACSKGIEESNSSWDSIVETASELTSQLAQILKVEQAPVFDVQVQ